MPVELAAPAAPTGWRSSPLADRAATAAVVVFFGALVLWTVLDIDRAWALALGWGIHPEVFIGLSILTLPFEVWGAMRSKRGVFAGDRSRVFSGVVINRSSAAVAFVYAAVAGSGLPWWLRPLVAGYVLVVVAYVVAVGRSRRAELPSVAAALGGLARSLRPRLT